MRKRTGRPRRPSGGKWNRADGSKDLNATLLTSDQDFVVLSGVRLDDWLA
ncbi:MAG: hypothetical protein HY721_34160 [Planctomycetes bacterium]|nr:hypothetical protein [Planctomycetota bacterium]